MMVAARRNESGLGTEALLQFKPEHAAIKSQGAVEISHFQMHVADANLGINGEISLRHDFF